MLLPNPGYQYKDALLQVNHRGAGWEWKTSFEVRVRLTAGQQHYCQFREEDLWLEAGIFLQPDGSAPALPLGGSNHIEPLDNRPVARNGVRGKLLKHLNTPSYVFSASGVAFQDSSLFLGHVTFDLVSYSAASYDPGTRRYAFRNALLSAQGNRFRYVL